MVNTPEFTKRLEKICQEHDLSGAAFAERIDVGRATISHIMSGRNKPSLDFVMKVVSSFPDVDLYWLLNGRGSYPKNIQPEIVQRIVPNTKSSDQPENPEQEQNPAINPVIEKKLASPANGSAIKRVVIFFEDGTFESYTP
ncbi:XRE family transcriptional regulator [Dokdonia sinensis]|uniref:XRE family transcriptional regulator n=1 Tax=Dokdonia sinensis TaxID=2479847 RepID=A0A3M0G7A3_9FLAO|nr:helix-turn-helix transcriptional regulator [Dokdonia sinensis]RMB57563.1 XRE family transcriptional regulator [Dokdonia sinensis]